MSKRFLQTVEGEAPDKNKNKNFVVVVRTRRFLFLADTGILILIVIMIKPSPSVRHFALIVALRARMNRASGTWRCHDFLVDYPSRSATARIKELERSLSHLRTGGGGCGEQNAAKITSLRAELAHFGRPTGPK